MSKKDEWMLGRRFTLNRDNALYGGRSIIEGTVKAGTEVEVVSVGFVQVKVRVTHVPFGTLSWWVHSIALSPLHSPSGCTGSRFMAWAAKSRRR